MNKYDPVEPINIHIQPLMNIMQEKNRLITTKKGKGKLPLFRGNGEQVIPIYSHNCTHCQSLVELGDNGGVAGEYITVINIPSHGYLNIQVIDNHEITSVPIDIVGALDHSQAGPVIIIMHQY